jgi:tetratricopeptide (TPR) repeat protein
MRPDDAEALDELERDYQLGELVRRARRAISLGRLAQAEQAAAQAAELAPNTTTVEELLGDVAMARGQFAAARDHFRRALEIEPANADAEVKYGEAVLKLGTAVHLRERVEEIAENPEEYEGFRRSPVAAAFWSVIPGLGQLYNHEYEKGLAILGAATILLAWVLSKLLAYSGASLIAGARNPRLRTEVAEQIVQGYGPFMWTLIVLAILAYLVIWVWSIVDAYRVCSEQAQQADLLGVEG